MTAIFVMRHPETTWNRVSRYQGRLDTPLSPEGDRQLQARVASFRGQSLDCVISSPLSRAYRLARRLADETDAPLRVDSRWTEMAQGAWEGLYLREIKERYGELLAAWHTRPDRVTFPGGESLDAVQKRYVPAFMEVFRDFPHGMVAIVSHSVVVQLLVAACLNLQSRYLHSVRIANASVTTVCGTGVPGRALFVNSIEALYGSPVEAARAMGCDANEPGRITT